jgi:hypothetical protein
MNARNETFLRGVLLVDAISSGAMGLVLIAGAALLSSWLHMPAALLQYSGLTLLPFAALVAWVALRRPLVRPAVWAVIVLNALWAADSLLLLGTGWVAPSVLGYAFVIAQAAFVAVLAELEYVGLRRQVLGVPQRR